MAEITIGKKNKLLVVDLDGTVSNAQWRADKYLPKDGKRDYDTFYELCDQDEPIKNICDLVSRLSDDHVVVFLTGRPVRVREKSSQWIMKNIPMKNPLFFLLMKSNSDYRKDFIAKPDILNKWLRSMPQDLFEVDLILEDRTQVAEKWRELGYTCLQVANGDF